MAILLFSCAAPVAAQVRLSPADCARVTSHVADASVAYRPGVDAAGRAVAPADLGPPQRVVPERLWFVLSADLQQRLNLPRGLSGDLPLGIVSIEGNQVLFNGEPIGGGAEAALAAACASARREPLR